MEEKISDLSDFNEESSDGGSKFGVSFGYAKKSGVFLSLDKDKIYCRKGDFSISSLNEITRKFQTSFTLINLDEAEFNNEMENLYSKHQTHDYSEVTKDIEEMNLDSALSELEEKSDLLENADDAPIVKLLNAIFFEAIRDKASDIHIEPFENFLYVRMRIDGTLHTKLKANPKISPIIISRIKVLARLDIAEKRVPQDGRISLKIGGRAIDLRVSTLPSGALERVVMRILDKKATRLSLESLGMPRDMLEQFKAVINKPNGIVLVTGPTGSGKTTTLYASLEHLDRSVLNIMTVEDPIEYFFQGISQTQVNVKAGMTFARGLRAILRQDPDVVMIGEIRDLETAEIAIQASLTGHLVLSTLHTNSAIGALTRLADMGLQNFLVASTIQATLAQRLVRKVCQACKVERPVSDEERFIFEAEGLVATTIFSHHGCTECENTGYKGREGIYEFVIIDNQLRHMINKNESEISMADYAFKEKRYMSLQRAALMLVVAGKTTFAEAMRIAGGN